MLMLQESREVASKKRRKQALRAVTTMTTAATKVSMSNLTVKGLKDTSKEEAVSDSE